MKVTLMGEMTTEVMIKKLVEVVENTAIKVQTEADAKIKGWSIHEADISVKFDVEGMDEPMLLTVEHHEGQPEVLQWIVDVGKEQLSNNENESMYDAWSVAQAQGKDFQFKEIESQYKDIALQVESSEEFGDMKKVIYQAVKDDYKIVRVYQLGRLIQEYRLNPVEK